MGLGDFGGNIWGNQDKEGRDPRRTFTSSQKKDILYQQDNKCARCHKKLDPRAIQFDHKKPWAARGRTITKNGRALCGECHDIITHETRVKKVDKRKKRQENGIYGLGDLPKIKPPKLF